MEKMGDTNFSGYHSARAPQAEKPIEYGIIGKCRCPSIVTYTWIFAIFNLIPIPPLDGSRILYAFLPSKALLWFQRYEQYFFWGLLGVFLIFNILNINIIGGVANFFVKLIYKLFFI